MFTCIAAVLSADGFIVAHHTCGRFVARRILGPFSPGPRLAPAPSPAVVPERSSA